MFHILVHHGPNKGEIVLQFAAYIVYDICKRMEGDQRPLSRLPLALLEPWKQAKKGANKKKESVIKFG